MFKMFALALASMPMILGSQASAGYWIREGYGVVYGTVGGVGGAAVGGLPGEMAGGYAGQQFGYQVYDNSARSLQGLRSAPGPTYNVYAPPMYRTQNSTPMYIQRRY